MSGAISEFEALPELEGIHELHEGSAESEQFFRALAGLARRGAGWLTQADSRQRDVALAAARQALDKGMPALGAFLGHALAPTHPTAMVLGTAAGGAVGGGLGRLLPQKEYELELEGEFEVNPVRKIYPDAMLEHLGHAAAESESEAEAEALAGAMIPLVTRVMPLAAPTLMHATPGLVSGVSGVVHRLRRDPLTRPLVRVVPAIIKGTAATLARQAMHGAPATPQDAVRTLARQTLRVLGSPQASARAFRRSQALDRHYHRTCARGPAAFAACPRCGGYMR